MTLELTDIAVENGPSSIICSLASPPSQELCERPALVLVFGADRKSVLNEEKCYQIAQTFVSAGHRALSYDLPNHGQFEDSHGGGLIGMAAAFAAGDDPFQRFVGMGHRVIDHCLQQGLAEEGRLFVFGRSRGGFCALRLMAADRRVNGAMVIAPVTDWRLLDEFSGLKDAPQATTLSLQNQVEALAGRPMYVAIGNNDDRVSTKSCIEFVSAVLAADPASAERRGGSAGRTARDHSGGPHAIGGLGRGRRALSAWEFDRSGLTLGTRTLLFAPSQEGTPAY